jgi:hypothetical protein
LDPLIKFVPVMVSGKELPPATVVVGLSDAMVGPFTANVLAGEEQALGFWTVTYCGPAETSCALVTAAVNEVALTYVVASGVEFHIAVDPLMKFVPVMVRVKSALPATADAGPSDAMVGP